MVEQTNFGEYEEYEENEEMNDEENGFGEDEENWDAWDEAEEAYLVKKESSTGAFEAQGILNPSRAH